MTSAASAIVLLCAMQTTVAAWAGEVVAGSYVRAGSNFMSSATLVVHEYSDPQATISLEVLAKPSASATTARTGTLDKELVQVSGQTGLYRDTASGPGGCVIEFTFAKRHIQVLQTGGCALFGVGINATGKYVIRNDSVPSPVTT